MFDYDLFVIGAGSGGVRAARTAAALGAKVGIAESRFFGGTCVNVGCVPKKLMVYASRFHDEFQSAPGFGWQLPGDPGFSWSGFLTNKDREIQRLNGVYQHLLASSGIDIHWGHARLIGPQEVEVDGASLSARHILVATGSKPHIPAFPGSELASTSDDLFHMPDLPASLVVVGGGYIAIEFAGIFAGLGVDTTLLYRGELFLRGFDEDVRRFVAEEVVRKGIKLRFKTQVQQISGSNGELTVELADGTLLETERVLYATGRRPNTEGLGLGEQGITCRENGEIVVDDHFRTSVPSVYALGDVTGGMQLTPVALAEGMALARQLFTGSTATVNYEQIPTAVFCQPNIGTVGMTEQEARETWDAIDVYRSVFKPMKHTLSGHDERCMMKLVVNRQDDRVVGAHMVGDDAGEIIQGIAVAMKAGATKQVFDATIGIHPTAAEEFVTMREPV